MDISKKGPSGRRPLFHCRTGRLLLPVHDRLQAADQDDSQHDEENLHRLSDKRDGEEEHKNVEFRMKNA